MWLLENFVLRGAACIIFLLDTSAFHEGWHFFCQGRDGDCFRLSSRMVVSVATIQLCYYSRQVARDKMDMHGCGCVKKETKKQVYLWTQTSKVPISLATK